MCDKKENNQIDIFKSVKPESITELTFGVLESGLNLITDSGLIKDIPAFGIGFKSCNLYQETLINQPVRQLSIF